MNEDFDPVRRYFAVRNAIFTELTFENFVRWSSAMTTYRRSYPNVWNNAWYKSFGPNMRRALYNFNFSPTAKARNESFSHDIILGVIFANYMFGLELINFATNQRGGTNIYVSEVFATMGLVMIIFLSKKKNVAMSVAAFIGGAYWFTSSTSFANPAATISRVFSDSFAGINPEYILPFLIAQLFGGLIAFWILKPFKRQKLNKK